MAYGVSAVEYDPALYPLADRSWVMGRGLTTSSALHGSRSRVLLDLVRRPTRTTSLLQLHHRMFPAPPGRSFRVLERIPCFLWFDICLHCDSLAECYRGGVDVGHGCLFCFAGGYTDDWGDIEGSCGEEVDEQSWERVGGYGGWGED